MSAHVGVTFVKNDKQIEARVTEATPTPTLTIWVDGENRQDFDPPEFVEELNRLMGVEADWLTFESQGLSIYLDLSERLSALVRANKAEANLYATMHDEVAARTFTTYAHA